MSTRIRVVDPSDGSVSWLSGVDGKVFVSGPYESVTASELLAAQSAGFASLGYTAPQTFFVEDPENFTSLPSSHWIIWEGGTDGASDTLDYDQRLVNGASMVYGMARNGTIVTAAAYSATQILGFLVVAQPTADDSTMTFVGDSTDTATAALAKE
ncbi:MAG: hypothetical protein ACWGQW_02820, partial [bacterium]